MTKQKYKIPIYTAAHRHLSWSIPQPHKTEHYRIILFLWATILVLTAGAVIRP